MALSFLDRLAFIWATPEHLTEVENYLMAKSDDLAARLNAACST